LRNRADRRDIAKQQLAGLREVGILDRRSRSGEFAQQSSSEKGRTRSSYPACRTGTNAPCSARISITWTTGTRQSQPLRYECGRSRYLFEGSICSTRRRLEHSLK